jgi:hypothetical protein
MDTNVTVGGREVTLALPGSMAIRYDIVGAGSSNAQRALWAALGVCWTAGTSAGAPSARLSRHQYDPMAYGGAVFDELVSRGATPSQLLTAGRVAYDLLSANLVDESEVEEALGNSGASTEGST